MLLPEEGLMVNPIPIYNSTVSMNGINAVFIIVLIFLKISVWVNSQIRCAPDDIGEQRSPKNIPEIIAPPAYMTGIFMLCAKVIQITPIVAELPKAVPIKKDPKQHNKKAIRSIICGTANIEA